MRGVRGGGAWPGGNGLPVTMAKPAVMKELFYGRVRASSPWAPSHRISIKRRRERRAESPVTAAWDPSVRQQITLLRGEGLVGMGRRAT